MLNTATAAAAVVHFTDVPITNETMNSIDESGLINWLNQSSVLIQSQLLLNFLNRRVCVATKSKTFAHAKSLALEIKLFHVKRVGRKKGKTVK